MNSKRIFTFWEPFDKIPSYLQLCMQTWEKFLPDYEIVLLHYGNLEQWIGKNLFANVLYKSLSLTKQADAIRCAVLFRHGGVWFDTDTIVTSASARKILDTSAEFTLFGRHIGFIVAQKNSNILKEWEQKIHLVLSMYENKNLKMFKLLSDANWFEQWNFIGNLLLDEILDKTENKNFNSLNRYFYNALPEVKTNTNTNTQQLIINNYKDFYFSEKYSQLSPIMGIVGNDFIKIDINKESLFGPIICLHNSWTPHIYKQMPKEEFLKQNILLSKVLNILLAYNVDNTSNIDLNTFTQEKSIEINISEPNDNKISIINKDKNKSSFDAIRPSFGHSIKNLLFHPLIKKQAFALCNSNQLDCAEAIAQNVIANNPYMAWAYYILGKVQWERGEHTEALKNIDRAVALEPKTEYFHIFKNSCIRKYKSFTKSQKVIPSPPPVHITKSPPSVVKLPEKYRVHKLAVTHPESLFPYAKMLKRLTTIDVKNVFEIGANYAQDSEGLRVFFNLQDSDIWVFEAHPQMVSEIRKMYNFNCFEKAVSDRNGKIKFHAIDLTKPYGKYQIGQSSLLNKPSNSEVMIEITAESIRMDDFMNENNIDKIDFLKLDVEGATYEVLLGFGNRITDIKSIHLESEHIEIWKNQKLYADIFNILVKNNFEQIYFRRISPGQSDSFWINKEYLK